MSCISVHTPIALLELIGPLGILLQFLIDKFQIHFKDKYLKYLLWYCYPVNATAPH